MMQSGSSPPYPQDNYHMLQKVSLSYHIAVIIHVHGSALTKFNVGHAISYCMSNIKFCQGTSMYMYTFSFNKKESYNLIKEAFS